MCIPRRVNALEHYSLPQTCGLKNINTLSTNELRFDIRLRGLWGLQVRIQQEGSFFKYSLLNLATFFKLLFFRILMPIRPMFFPLFFMQKNLEKFNLIYKGGPGLHLVQC